MKKIKIGLLPRIIIAIILGIAIGTIFPAPLVRIFVTFNGIFSEFLNFSIPLIIVGLVTVAIADIGKGAGKMLLVTALIGLRRDALLRLPVLLHRCHRVPLAHRSGRAARRSQRSARHSPLLLRIHPSADECHDGIDPCLHTGIGTGGTAQRCSEECSTGFSGNHRAHDQCGHPAFTAALHLRHFPEYDSFRTSICHSDGLYQNHRSYLSVTYLPARLSVFHCSTLRP